MEGGYVGQSCVADQSLIRETMWHVRVRVGENRERALNVLEYFYFLFLK